MGCAGDLAHYYDMSTPVGLPDLGVPGGNPGTGANIASNPTGIHGNSRCAELNGNNSHYNLGDVVEMNEVSALTIAFWMNQDVIDVLDIMFSKTQSITNQIRAYTNVDGHMYLVSERGGTNGRAQLVNYSTAVAAGTWHHFASVFDGSLIGDANRLKIYIDAQPMTLAFVGVIEALTPDLSGTDMTIGAAANAWDGKLDSFAIFSNPLTQMQVAEFKLATAQGRI